MSPQLLVADLERSIEFYTRMLDFTLDFRYEDFYAGLSKEGYSIHLKLDTYSLKENRDQNLEITFSVSNIEHLYHELTAKGIAFAQPLRKMPYGTEFYIADPDGNLISFLE